jgi:hypothetical protein
MKTRVMLAALALMLTIVLLFAAHAEGYPLLAEADPAALVQVAGASR